MFFIFAVALTVEFVFIHNFTHRWVIGITMLCNFWGNVDALLRYPSVQDFNSFFTWKQFFLLIAKTGSLATAIIKFNLQAALCFIAVSLLIWVLPGVYLMALPFDPIEAHLDCDDARDVDL